MLLARTAHVSFKHSLWGLVYFYISPEMPLNTGISGDISFIKNWTFIHFHLSFVVIECFWDISTRYDNYVAHQHIHHLHGEQMNLIKDTWHTRHTPRVYPTYVILPLSREAYPLVYSKQFNPKKFDLYGWKSDIWRRTKYFLQFCVINVNHNALRTWESQS